MQRRVFFVVSSFITLAFGFLVSGSALAASHAQKVCSDSVRAGYARCFSSIVSDPSGLVPLATSKPQGYGPSVFKTAYGDRGASPTNMAVVVAYDAPTVLNDLAIYSKQYGLPVPVACKSTAQTGCVLKVNQGGTASLPSVSSSWAVETSMDTEIAHAMCPGCRLTIVEASSSSMANLAAAAQEAVALGAKVISNSYGGSESSGEAAYDRDYTHSGVAEVVSSGDSGYGVNYPASSPGVVAVGGTTLNINGNRVTSETAWSGSGSGCSKFEYKPSWQNDKHCTMRSVADVAADADPNTGAAIYDSYPDGGHSGWYTIGGTSLAAPLVAGILANNNKINNQPAYLYANSALLRDITSGSNGSCSLKYLCSANAGYDGPTGLGVLSQL